MLETLSQNILILIAAGIFGYASTFLITFFLRWRIQKEGTEDRRLIIQSASRQSEQWSQLESGREDSDFKRMAADLEDELIEQANDLKNAEEDITMREKFVADEEERISNLEQKVQHDLTHITQLEEKNRQLTSTHIEFKKEFFNQIQKISGLDAKILQTEVTEQLVNDRTLTSQKYLNQFLSELDKQSKKRAVRAIDRVLTRYSPNFYWPKPNQLLEVSQSTHIQKLLLENDPDLALLKELAEIEIETKQSNDSPNLIVKLAGGMGLKREAARLALIDITNHGPNHWNQLKDIFQSYEIKLRNYSLELGRKAVINLGISNIHPEIQRMVGFLNWRTSYRQNQYLHTFEVAKLAGIVAEELGVDSDKAKRCGLMHDIGKSIDYRIEGGHALISGDYADRFGENQEITDTVMSHHDELVLDTPLSFVLKTADTLSGARPGARVNLEEGYQMRLSDLNDAVRHFNGVTKILIMNGAREIHVEVDPSQVKDHQLASLSQDIARKIEESVSYPGQIKVLITRKFESTAVA